MKKYLGNSALKSLEKIGDILCPKNGEFPSYSEFGAIEFVDQMLQYAPASDIKDLNFLLSVLSIMPSFILKWIVRHMTTSVENNGVLSPLFRQLNFGFRGLIFSSYYAGKRPKNYTGKLPTELIDFSLNRKLD